MASKPKQTDTKLKKDVKNLKKKKYFHAKEKKGEKAKLKFAELKKKMSPEAKIWSIGNEWEFGGTKPTLNQAGRIREGVKTGGRVGLADGGRTNLLEELGRVEAEPSNANRRAEISRVHGELNKGYKTGGRVGFKHGSGRPKGGWTS